MKKKIAVVVSIIIFLILLYFLFREKIPSTITSLPINQTTKIDSENLGMVVLAQNLDTPWSLVFLPDATILMTERPGRVQLIQEGKEPQLIAKLENVKEIGKGGLLGMALHPQFESNNFIYFYYTFSESSDQTLNRVVRMKYQNEKLSGEEIIVDSIPGAPNHNGGRLKFGLDGFLYITTGDAQNPSQAQETKSLAGKILRVTDEGKPAPGNPFGNRVYSYGHRNPQGLAWDEKGQLWETEHGPSGLETGNDEFNKIEMGKNYGWPEIRGQETRAGMVTPIIESGRSDTWAPAGLAFIDGKFYFGGLRGEALYQVTATGANLETFFKGEFGRIREVIAGPDKMLYLTTSNLDGRGSPKEGDDKIIKLNPEKF